MRCVKLIMRDSIVESNMLRYRTCCLSISHFNVNPSLLLMLELKEMNVFVCMKPFVVFSGILSTTIDLCESCQNILCAQPAK